MKLQEVKTRIFNALLDTNIQLKDEVFEEIPGGFRWVLSIHNININIEEDVLTSLLHTKFFVEVEKDRETLKENSLHYLYDINCQYRELPFENLNDLRDIISRIVRQSDFGEDILLLSNFLSQAPISSINNLLSKESIDDKSITSIHYNPKTKITPCEAFTADFDLTINNGEDEISFSVFKVKDNSFTITYYHGTDIIEKNISTLENITPVIGGHIIEIIS